MDVLITAASGDEIHLGGQTYKTMSTQTLNNGQTASTQTPHNNQSVSTQTHDYQNTTSSQKPVKFLPTGLKLIRKLKFDNPCFTVCHYNGYTYVGQSRGGIDRIDQSGQIEKAFIKLDTAVISLVTHKDTMYILMFVSKFKPLTINIRKINDGKLVASWDHPYYQFVGQRMLLLGKHQLCVGDWTSKQIIIYSLAGRVLRKVPCPPQLTMTGDVSMTSCGPDSVVISDLSSGNIARMSLEDGRLLWSSDSIEHPGGIFYHQTGYVFVVSSSICPTTISVLDESDGNLFLLYVLVIKA